MQITSLLGDSIGSGTSLELQIALGGLGFTLSLAARVVSGGILAKWTLLNFETGPAGLPTADATSVVASTGTRAQQQTFARHAFEEVIERLIFE